MTRLFPLLEKGIARARERQRPVLVSLTTAGPDIDPVRLLSRACQAGGEFQFWAVPERNTYVVGSGEAHTFIGCGENGFTEIESQWRDMVEHALIERHVTEKMRAENGSSADAENDSLREPGGGPFLIGGFTFDPLRTPSDLWAGFPDGCMILPRVQWTRSDGRWTLTVNAVVQPEDDASSRAFPLEHQVDALFSGPRDESALPSEPEPAALEVSEVDPEGWIRSVESAASMIREGRLAKVVLAREVQVRAPRPMSIPRTVEALKRRYPSCYVFVVAREGRCFVGASPEQLARVRGREVNVMGLAGTARRDASPEEDRRLGEALLASPKEREEHGIVVRTIEQALKPLCDFLHIPPTPELLRLRNVQHLCTPIRGRLSDDHTVFDVARRLHPTPALGGYPRDVALALIRELEAMHRGWYASPLGWVNHQGDGEFAVAIRSALIEGHRASLFTGCGVMGDSDPQAEYEETRAKLQPMMDALTAAAGGDRS